MTRDWAFHPGPLCFVCGATAEHWFQFNPPTGTRYWFCASHWNKGVVFEGGERGWARVLVGDETRAFVPTA